MLLRVISIVVLLACVSEAWAWGTKEHILLTRLAVMRIVDDPTASPALKDFLKTTLPGATTLEDQKQFFLNANLGATPRGLHGLAFWVVEPDIRANNDKKTNIEPFGVPERVLHFVDLEYLHADLDRRFYKHDLSNRLDLADVPTDSTDERFRKAGLLPFAVQRSFEKLTQAFKENRLFADPQRPKDEDYALRWVGYLAHYAQDNCQPLHSTSDYKCQSYFADKRTAPNVHSELEWRMNDDEKEGFPALRADYWAALIKTCEGLPDDPYATQEDVWKETLAVSDHAYAHLPLVGLAAMHAAGQKGTPDKPTGPAGAFDTDKFFRFQADVDGQKISVLQMKANQQALAITRTASLIRRAWDAAHP